MIEKLQKAINESVNHKNNIKRINRINNINLTAITAITTINNENTSNILIRDNNYYNNVKIEKLNRVLQVINANDVSNLLKIYENAKLNDSSDFCDSDSGENESYKLYEDQIKCKDQEVNRELKETEDRKDMKDKEANFQSFFSTSSERNGKPKEKKLGKLERINKENLIEMEKEVGRNLFSYEIFIMNSYKYLLQNKYDQEQIKKLETETLNLDKSNYDKEHKELEERKDNKEKEEDVIKKIKQDTVDILGKNNIQKNENKVENRRNNITNNEINKIENLNTNTPKSFQSNK